VTRHILLVEDDRLLRRACETKLKQRGFEVRVAADGEEALLRVSERIPDLILLDLLMPKLDGLGVLAVLRGSEKTRSIPVVILSNSSKELEMHEASTLGALAYWIKSNLSLQEMCDRVERLLNGTPV
jgi:DNA-binding response OmpR family regulator